jgi:hypothetical protein
MTTIYLMHPKHGVKVATMEAEAQYDEMNGWRRFELEDLQDDDAVEPDAILPDAEVEANVMAEAPRRRGRPRKDD